MKNAFLMLGISMLITACGGSSSSTPTPIPDANIGGIWYGFNANDQSGSAEEFIGIATEDGRFRFLELATLVQFSGAVTFDGETADGTGLAFAAPGSTWTDGSVVSALDITGTVFERQSIEGGWTLTSGDSGNYGLLFDALYFRASGLDLTAGVWIMTDDTGAQTGTLTIEADGTLNGQDVNGCLFGGSVGIIDAAFNAYDASFAVSNCGEADGDYTGLGILGDSAALNDSMLIVSDNGTASLVGMFMRMPAP
jgi:hypothetical protein